MALQETKNRDVGFYASMEMMANTERNGLVDESDGKSFSIEVKNA